MTTQRAYTLIELLIVIAIILMLTVLGLPAFTKYQKISEFKSKVDEVKELLNQAYSLASAPAGTSTEVGTNIESYQVYYDSVSTTNKYSLYACTVANGCDMANPINVVSLGSDETIQSGGTFNPPVALTCSTAVIDGRSVQCSTGQPLDVPATSFRDSNSAVNRLAKFSLNRSGLFKIDIEISDQ